jgi:hypothetical protein
MFSPPRSLPWWFLVALQIVSLSALVPLVWWYATLVLPPADEPPLDFFQEWSSARAWFEGLPLYGDIGEAVVRTGVYQPRPGDVLLLKYNAHPPGAVLLVLPLGGLPYRTALLVWGGLSLLALFAAFWLIAAELRLPVSPWLYLPLLVLLLLCNPISQQTHQGQLNSVLLFVLVLAWRANRQGRESQAGLWIGLATAIKLFPGLLFWYLLWRRKWRALGVGVVTLLGAFLLVLGILGWQTCRDYVTQVVPSLSAFRSSWINASLWGYWFRLFSGSTSENVEPLLAADKLAHLLVFASAGIILVILALVTVRSHTAGADDGAWGLHHTAMLLLSPLTWDHSLVLLAVPLACVGRDLLASDRWRMPFFLLLCLMWIGYLPYWKALVAQGSLPPVAGPLLSVTLLAIPNYVLLAFFGLQLVQFSIGLHPQVSIGLHQQGRQTNSAPEEAATS